jgi:hypothetical protein
MAGHQDTATTANRLGQPHGSAHKRPALKSLQLLGRAKSCGRTGGEYGGKQLTGRDGFIMWVSGHERLWPLLSQSSAKSCRFAEFAQHFESAGERFFQAFASGLQKNRNKGPQNTCPACGICVFVVVHHKLMHRIDQEQKGITICT